MMIAAIAAVMGAMIAQALELVPNGGVKNGQGDLNRQYCSVANSSYGVVATEPVQVLFPYTIVGRVVDAENKAFDAESGVSMKVSSADGVVLAMTKAYTPGTLSAWNFRLSVPVASAHVAGYAAKGDTLTLTVYKDGVIYTGFLKGDDARIGEAGASVSLRIMLSEDANGNGIADTWEKSKYNWMRKYKITGEFDPNADYDGDGQTNYAEYLAGTDPFDAADRLGVDTLENDMDYDGRYLKVTFEMNPGRTYSLREAADVETAVERWEKGRFKTDPESETTTERVVNSRSQWQMMTIYLLKQGEKRFYRIEMEQ